MRSLLQYLFVVGFFIIDSNYSVWSQTDNYHAIDSIPIIDSAFLSISPSTIVDPYNSNNTIDVFNISIEVYDIDSIGSVEVTVYNDMNIPIGQLEYTLTELNTISAITGNTISLSIADIDPTKNYMVDAIIRTYHEAYLPKMTAIYDVP